MHFFFEDMDHHSIQFRMGSPLDRTELMKVSAPFAADIIVMGSGLSGRNADQDVMQIMMALGALPGDSAFAGDIFAEVHTEQSARVVRTIVPSADGILARPLVYRVVALRAVVPSVGFVYLETGTFRRGQMFHVVRMPKRLVGMHFRDASALLPKAVLCAVHPAHSGGGDESIGSGMLATHSERKLREDDELLVLARTAADARCVQDPFDKAQRPRTPLSPPPKHDRPDLDDEVGRGFEQPDGQLLLGPSAAGPRTIVILGCPEDMPGILHVLDTYLASGSEVHVLSPKSLERREEAVRRYFASTRSATFDGHKCFQRIQPVHHVGDHQCEYELSRLPLEKADCALILAEVDEGCTPAVADSRNLAVVISLRAVLNERRATTNRCKVVTELLDPKSQQVLDRNNSVRRLGSFVYSNNMATGLFAMAAAETCAFQVWRELLDPASACHIGAQPVRDVVATSEDLSFYDLQARVWDSCGAVLLGWRRAKERYPELNPRSKSTKLMWNHTAGDELLILRFPPDDFSPVPTRNCDGHGRTRTLGEGRGPPGCVGADDPELSEAALGATAPTVALNIPA